MLSKSELVYLLNFKPDSPQSYLVMAEADHISREISLGKAEVHARISVTGDCVLPNQNFNTAGKRTAHSIDQLISQIHRVQSEGANAIIIKPDQELSFAAFLEISQEIGKNVHAKTTLIADAGDLSFKSAVKLKTSGFAGVYYSLRLGDSHGLHCVSETSNRSIQNFIAAGLQIGTCLENIGAEHTDEQIAAMIEYIALLKPSCSGVARKEMLPGAVLSENTIISDLRIAQIIAISRLGMSSAVYGNCTHEPCTLGAIAGANIFRAEVLSGAGDNNKREHYLEKSVRGCQTVFRNSNWDILNGPSRFYN